jgi:hypothetical protein
MSLLGSAAGTRRAQRTPRAGSAGHRSDMVRTEHAKPDDRSTEPAARLVSTSRPGPAAHAINPLTRAVAAHLPD